jgi:hypothetical protein
MDHGQVAEIVVRAELSPDAPQFRRYVGV